MLGAEPDELVAKLPVGLTLHVDARPIPRLLVRQARLSSRFVPLAREDLCAAEAPLFKPSGVGQKLGRPARIASG
jgi:hypothetical protein